MPRAGYISRLSTVCETLRAQVEEMVKGTHFSDQHWILVMRSYVGTEGRNIPFIVGAVDEPGQTPRGVLTLGA